MIRFLALAPLLAVWASGATLPDPRGGELRVAIKAEPRSLDPLLVTDEPSQALRYLTGGVLIRMNRQTQRPEPALAERWSVSRDGKKIVFQLRGGLRFSDGTLCGARDVEAALARVLDPKTVSPAADAFRAAFVGARVERTGDRGITLSFDRPVPGFERYFDEISITGAGGIRTSAGPFYLAEHTPGVGLTLARNPHYWKRDAAGRPLPYLERVRLEVIQNRDVELLRFRKGELDLMNALDAETFDRLRTEMPGSAQDIGQSLDLEQLWFNQSGRGRMAEHKRTWFRSREFRLGVSAAIAREDLARVVYRGHARPAYGPVSPANQFWFHGGLGAPRTGTEAALAHFRKAGFRLVGNTLRDAAGNAVEFSVITNAGSKPRERMAVLIQSDLARVGIKLNVVTLDFPALVERIMKSLDYEACLLGLMNVELDPNSQMNVWLSTSAMHPWNPSQAKPETPWEAEIDRLMHAQAASADPKERKAAFDRVQRIVRDEAPVIYLVHKNVLTAVHPRVANAQPVILFPQSYWNAESLAVER